MGLIGGRALTASPNVDAEASPSRRGNGRRLEATVILLIQWGLPTLGFLILEMDRGFVKNGWLVLCAPILFLFGAAIVRSRTSVLKDDQTWLLPFLKASMSVVLLLAIIHFASVGIPVLQANVETSRFEVGGSGYAGLPSRGVLYALPCLTLLSLATLRPSTRKVTSCIWLLFFLTQVALGFKGALVEVLIVTAIGYAVGHRFKVWQILVFAASGIVALFYVQFVGAKYATLAGGSGLDYILRRSTSDAIIAGYVAMTSRPVGLTQRASVLYTDFGVLLDRYIHGGTSYTFDELVSSVVTGTPITPGAFLVPVTVGGPVYLLYSLPVLAAAIVLIALGGSWSWMLGLLAEPPSALLAVLATVSIYGIRVFLLNGNGSYLFINMAFTGLILVVCSVLARARIFHRPWSPGPKHV
ncbi:hypothetical protein [Frondihabitans sp. Leaf304]|uniref:hypothetical protein n=1 Tax=Frondihabitans sp. Leaf304 TaxID=1736329 RepID=UPI0006F6184A|nr:hypothetical protein [Frondihabitans sp. Leaf304]KQQ28372.1 hypothetical protein ASF54_06740 [Frondihabitans sp. Leaf304]